MGYREALIAVYAVMMIAVFYFLRRWQTRDNPVKERLDALDPQSASAEAAENVGEQKKKQRSAFGGLLETIGKRLASGKRTQTIKKNLSYAGYRSSNAPVIFMGVKTVVAVACAMLMFTIRLSKGIHAQDLFVIGAAALAGFSFPNIWLLKKAERRQQNTSDGVPDALDILVVCVEAGLGLGAALKKVADELQSVHPLICSEFRLTMLEIEAGVMRRDAFKRLSDRTGVDDLKSLSVTFIQADGSGMSISETLRLYSDTLRTERRQRAEEQAAKASVKMLLPLLMFQFPATMILVLGPAVIRIVDVLGDLPGRN